MANNQTIGERIKTAREAGGLTQAQLAAKCGLSDNWVCNIECGRRSPNLFTLSRLARALGLTTDYLIGHNSQSNHQPNKRKAKANGK